MFYNDKDDKTIQESIPKRFNSFSWKTVCLVLITLIAGAGSICAQSYEKLWKEVEAYRKKSLPKSALLVANQIIEKSKKEHNKGQELKGILHACVLRQEVVPDSFFSDIRMLEQCKIQAKSQVEQMVYASVLGEIYVTNRFRSQIQGLTMTAPADSVQEWSREQYDSASVSNYLFSLKSPALLIKEKSSVYLPFVVEGEHARYFNGDLLNIVIRRALNGLRGVISNQKKIENLCRELMTNTLQAYRNEKNKEAELLLLLDSIDYFSQTEHVPLYQWKRNNNNTPEEKELLELKSVRYLAYMNLLDRFGQLPLAAEVYLRMLELDVTPKRKVEWAEQAVKQYADYERINALVNMLSELRAPWFEWKGRELIYPQKNTAWEFKARNLSKVKIVVYRMSHSFDEEKMNESTNMLAYIKKHGVIDQQIEHVFTKHPQYEVFSDTLQWKAQKPGVYVAFFYPETLAKIQDRKSNSFCIIRSSRLKILTLPLPNKQMNIVVVDAETGNPMPQTTIQLHNDFKGKKTIYHNGVTNEEGKLKVGIPAQSNQLWITAYNDSDKALPQTGAYSIYQYNPDQPKAEEVNLYTDRSLYRPGQTVHVGGIVYRSDKTGAQVVKNKSCSLILLDAKQNEIARREAKTNEMGTVSALFTLPQVGIPGQYYIKMDGATCSFRVEEYKRPTYKVSILPLKGMYAPGDTVRIEGHVKTYAGTPVKRARLTGKWNFSTLYRISRQMLHNAVNTDTVYTNDDGCFSITLCLDVLPEALQHGGQINLKLDALSQVGETQSGSYNFPLRSNPLHLQVEGRNMQDKENLSSILVRMLSPNNTPIAGKVNGILYKKEKGKQTKSIAMQTVIEANKPHTFKEWDKLTSGVYELHLNATVGQDTASSVYPFILFSCTDTKLVIDTIDWCYNPVDSFDATHPAIIQIGSNASNVALYYDLFCGNKLLESRLIHFSDSILNFTYPYKEEYGEGIGAYFTFVKEGRMYTHQVDIKHRRPDSRLRMEWTSFRDKLIPGAQEEWRLRITTPAGKPASAQLMAALYDASLDQLQPHSWALNVIKRYMLPRTYWNTNYISGVSASVHFDTRWLKVKAMQFDTFDANILGAWFLGSEISRGYVMDLAMPQAAPKMKVANGAMRVRGNSEEITAVYGTQVSERSEAIEEKTETLQQIPEFGLRTNFQETAFFYPQLRTDNQGEVTLSFVLPESLTTWNFMGLAHTQDMLTGQITEQITAQKDFMVQLHLPRFLRAGDKVYVQASLNNLTDSQKKGKIRLEVFEPETEKVIFTQKENFTAQALHDTVFVFSFDATKEYPLLACRVVAQSGTFSDGEQRYLPVLSQTERVTESIEINLNEKGNHTIDLSNLFHKNDKNATNRQLTVEYTTSPIWYAIQALPALAKPKEQDILSLAAAYYATGMATYIAQKTPKLTAVIQKWKQTGGTSQTLWSNLQKNESLKNVLLEETPWMLEARDEKQRKEELAVLFDVNTQIIQRQFLLEQIRKQQLSNGAFAWFYGMHANEYITRQIVELLVRFQWITQNETQRRITPLEQEERVILTQAFAYLTKENKQRVVRMRKEQKQGIKQGFPDDNSLHYLYIASHIGFELTASDKKDLDYLMGLLCENIAQANSSQKAIAATVLSRAGEKERAQAFVCSLKEHLVTNNAHGCYMDYPSGSFASIDRKQAVHVEIMEAMMETENTNDTTLKEMRRWLLLQKKTQNWNNPVNTANAVYALLKDNSKLLDSSVADELNVTFKNYKKNDSNRQTVEADKQHAAEMNLGYIYKQYQQTDGQLTPKTLEIKKMTEQDSWGAVYAQYSLPTAQLEEASTGLRIRREISSTTPRVGDKIIVRYIITADKDYEYVVLKDNRSACCEPVDTRSGYNNSGSLGYYQAVKDASTEFFFDRLSKGTYVIETTEYVEREGIYTQGIATLQCMYAPEFIARSKSLKIKVQKNEE